MLDPKLVQRVVDPSESMPREARRLKSTLRLCIAMYGVASFAWLGLGALFDAVEWPSVVLVLVGGLGLFAAWRAMQRGQLQRASWTIVASFIALTTLGLISNGVAEAAVEGGYMLAVISAGLLLGARQAATVVAICVACLLASAGLNEMGLLPTSLPPGRASSWLFVGITIIVGGSLLALASQRMRESVASERRSRAALERSNRKLRMGRDRYEALAENAHDLVAELDGDGRFLYINQAVKRVLGFAPGELLGTLAADLSHVDTRAGSTRAFPSLLQPGSAPQLFHAVHKDGSSRFLENSAAVYRTPSGEPRTTLFSRDVTARIEREERMRLLEERMARTQRTESLGLLASGIAHDFNNLLVGILANADEALMNLDEDDPVRPLVEEVMCAGEGAADLIRQLLAYTGKGALEVGPVDLSELARNTARMLNAGSRDLVTIDLQLDDAPVWIHADSLQIRQVILNLLTNALDALDGRGTVVLRTRTLGAEAGALASHDFGVGTAGGECALLEVQDTGCGMASDARDQIFEPFYTTKPTGRGLGLSTVLGAVRAHSGALDVSSELGGGTTIRVLFPSLHRSRADADTASFL